METILQLHVMLLYNNITNIQLIKPHYGMIGWLVDNKTQIKNGSVTYNDYQMMCSYLGILAYDEHSFDNYKQAD